LVFGDHPEHRRAEGAVAEWVGAEAALLFSSGYAANVGTVSALASSGDVVISDVLNHASIIDGCRLSGARVIVVPHLDASAIERALGAAANAERRWVVTESYFSMDGDIPDLARLRALCDDHDAALIVDEAHALGVFGPAGAGLCREARVRPDVLVGTLGKAVGLQGAFVAGSRSLRRWLWNRARSFVFSTGIGPALAEAAVVRIRRIAEDEPRRARLATTSDALRELIRGVGGQVTSTRGPILPWIFGDAAAAVRAARALEHHRVLVRAIRPPTVPQGTARLRLTASALLDEKALRSVKVALDELAGR
jgi:8-amino-7-oxononanoate synthase